MLAKINSIPAAVFVLAVALILSGCTPAGPRAFVKGKKYLDRGDVADAITEFRRATTLLATNSAAWNYFGVALQQGGQLDEAANAYRNALRFDHQLVEAHLNLGLLYLDQNKFDAARTELTEYTLRRPNDDFARLKLGFAQLGLGETLPAEQSFSAVLALKPNDPEAYNGLGLARLRAGKYHDSASFFAAAVQYRPNFGSALLNLATVELQYLHDTKGAIASYEAYLALTPRPENYDEVRELLANLERTQAPPAATSPPAQPTQPVQPVVARSTQPAAAPQEARPKPNVQNTPRVTTPARTEPEQTYASRPAKRTVVNAEPAPVAQTTTIPTQTVQVQPEPEIVTTPRPARPNVTPPPVAPATNIATTEEPLVAPVPDDEQPKSSFWHRYFGSSKVSNNSKPAAPVDSPAPSPGTSEEVNGGKSRETEAVQPVPQPILTFNRYHYKSPAKPAAGDNTAASGAFTKAQMAEQDENWIDAEQWYKSAADFDPARFEAQYNTAFIAAQHLHNYSVALPHYEMALAIQPDSVDARFQFALALKAAGYPLDAAAELKKILSAHPDNADAHLALANLYAQTIHDIPQARQHYLRVLALDPTNSHAAEIRFWLSANDK